MRSFYPPLEPHDSGMLDVGNGQLVYWEESGNPGGKPVVFLHGGPGGGTTAKNRQLFNPGKYKILLFDQRGCGRSTPHVDQAKTPKDLEHNTTWDLVADMERLRELRGVESWQVFGGSWGSTLGLAYAQMYPHRVTELVLRGIFTMREQEIAWFFEGEVSPLIPDIYEAFANAAPQARPGTMVETFHSMLWDPDPKVYVPAAKAWSVFEGSAIALLPREDLVEMFGDTRNALAFARLENHYFMNHGWLRPNQLLEDAHKIANIPGVIVNGRYDLATPVVNAWELHKAWPKADLKIIVDAGHAGDEPGTLDALITATDEFADS